MKHARILPDPSVHRFTDPQLLRIIAVCDVEMARNPCAYECENRVRSHQFADIQHAAFAILEGHGDDTELQALLDEIDYVPLWYACSPPKVAA